MAFTFGNNNNQKPATPNPTTSGAPSLFGSTNPTTTQTPTGMQPSNIFGSSSPATNLFAPKPSTPGPSTTPATGGFGGFGSTTPAGFTWGKSVDQTTTTAQNPTPSFFSKPSTTTTSTPATTTTPTTPFSFGSKSTTITPSAPTAGTTAAATPPTTTGFPTPSTPFTWGSAKSTGDAALTTTTAAAATTTTATTPTPPTTKASGFTWPTSSTPKPADSSATTTTPTTIASANPFTWGAKPADASSTTTAPAAPAPASTSNLWGTKPAADSGAAKLAEKPAEKPTDATSLAPAAPTTGLGSFSLPAKPPTTDPPKAITPAPATTTTSLSVAAPATPPVAPPSVLRGKTIEEIINKWTAELETQTKEFSKFAAEVAVWDRALIENGNHISSLYATVLQAEATQNAVDQSLDHIEQQQKELAATLDNYEKINKEIFDGQGGGLRALEIGPADSERDKNYTLASNMNAQLDELSKSLSQMIDSVNTLTIPSSNSTSSSTSNSQVDDPMTQIAGVLNEHLASLKWIDDTVWEVESKMKEAELKVQELSHGVGGAAGGGYGYGNGTREKLRSPDPAMSDANSESHSTEFAAPDADIILRSSDGHLFKVFRRILMEASPVFHGMICIPSPPEEQEVPVVDVPEDSFILDILLRFIYPVKEPTVTSLNILSSVLKVAEKYAMDSVLHSLRKVLVNPPNDFIRDSPLHVYALATMYDFKEEAQLASTRAIMSVDFLQLNIDQHPELSLINGKDLLGFLQLQQKYINGAISLLSTTSVAGPCSGCGGAPYWWREWVKRASEELRKKPATDIIFSAPFLAKSVQISGCAACPGHYIKQSSQARLESLAEVLARPASL